jgi:hypothetical protein
VQQSSVTAVCSRFHPLRREAAARQVLADTAETWRADAFGRSRRRREEQFRQEIMAREDIQQH